MLQGAGCIRLDHVRGGALHDQIQSLKAGLIQLPDHRDAEKGILFPEGIKDESDLCALVLQHMGCHSLADFSAA